MFITFPLFCCISTYLNRFLPYFVFNFIFIRISIFSLTTTSIFSVFRKVSLQRFQMLSSILFQFLIAEVFQPSWNLLQDIMSNTGSALHFSFNRSLIVFLLCASAVLAISNIKEGEILSAFPVLKDLIV